MSGKPDNNLSRDERLAAKLRENLRRRKGQARELSAENAESAPATLSNYGDGG